jgi:hypothetical protein
MDNPEKIGGVIKNGQSRETRGVIKNGQSRENGGVIKNGQSRENWRGNQEWTIQRKPEG